MLSIVWILSLVESTCWRMRQQSNQAAGSAAHAAIAVPAAPRRACFELAALAQSTIKMPQCR